MYTGRDAPEKGLAGSLLLALLAAAVLGTGVLVALRSTVDRAVVAAPEPVAEQPALPSGGGDTATTSPRSGPAPVATDPDAAGRTSDAAGGSSGQAGSAGTPADADADRAADPDAGRADAVADVPGALPYGTPAQARTDAAAPAELAHTGPVLPATLAALAAVGALGAARLGRAPGPRRCPARPAR